jgi:hypothetical protein
VVTMSRADEKFVKGLLTVGGTIALVAWLSSDPKCDSGCQSVLAHISDHVIGDFFASLA